ncbi:MAG: NupC/NupG family nucleoside CNT transporter [Fluviicola sp.]
MKKLSYILLLPILLLGHLSATAQDSIDPKSLEGIWSPKGQKHFIEFNGDQFKHNFGKTKDTISGAWSLNGNKLRLVQELDITQNIDSTVLVREGSKSKLLHYSDGAHVATTIGDSLIQEIGVQNVTVSKKKSGLHFKGDGINDVVYQPTQINPDKGMAFNFMSVIRGLLGMAFLIFIAYIFSANRSAINWSLIGKGVALQFIIAFLVLKVPFVEDIFNGISWVFVEIIGKTDAGVDFLFGQMGTGTVQPPLITFAIKVLPTIIFFSALVSLFYYWGILQKVVYIFAWIMKRFMKLSGAESLAAAGNVFLGQTEAPLLVKPYLLGMTKSEIMCLMTGGMATIAGGVLAAYVSFLGGDDPEQQAFFAKHLLTASIISAPAAIIAAKILVPETETINEKMSISKEKIGVNALEALSNGTTDGLKLAVNVGAMLLVFTALMALGNWLLGIIGGWTGANEAIAAGGVYSGLSFEFLLGYACRPIVWMMGVDWADSIYVGELLGTKTILNEFVAYPRLGEMKESGMIGQKSIIMSTYMLCGFANFASIGIQIGGIGSLVPTRKGLLSKLGVRALIGGTIACLLTAVIVGMTL